MVTLCIGCGRRIPSGTGGRCPGCRNPARRVRSQRPWRELAAATRAIGRCARCGTTTGPFEANHADPLADDPYQVPRAECLCLPCHRSVTNDQRAMRKR